ncbi:MAG: hypothetical protein Q9221_000207 [Calogaya cf. arnoldii]
MDKEGKKQGENSTAGDYYTRDLEILFRNELDRVKGRVSDANVPASAKWANLVSTLKEQRTKLERVMSQVKGPNMPIKDPNMSMLARSQKSATLALITLKEWKSKSDQRRLSSTGSMEIRTIEEQLRFLNTVKHALELDSWHKPHLWTAQERKDLMTIIEVVEGRVQEDPRY